MRTEEWMIAPLPRCWKSGASMRTYHRGRVWVWFMIIMSKKCFILGLCLILSLKASFFMAVVFRLAAKIRKKTRMAKFLLKKKTASLSKRRLPVFIQIIS